jgi:hypothetical protein
LLTGERIWFDPAPHITDRKTLDVTIDPVRPSATSSDTSLLPRSAGQSRRRVAL